MKYSEKILSSIQKTIKKSSHAFFLVDLGHVVRQHAKWIEQFPRVNPYFSLKCQPDPPIVEVLHKIGAKFDCSSQVEIEMAKKGGAASRDIIFSNPFKLRKDIQYSYETGIKLSSYDSEGELEKLKKFWPKAKLLLRIFVTDNDNAHQYGTEKFGVKLNRVPQLLKAAKENQFDVVGISFHVGIMNDDWNLWNLALERAHEVKEIMLKHDVNPTIINIGGGFPGHDILEDNDSKEELLFKNVRQSINQQLNQMFPANKGYEIIGTPGTHYVYGAYTLATQIIGKRTVNVENILNVQGTRNLHFGTVNEDNLKEVIGNEVSKSSKSPCSVKEGIVYIIDDGVYGAFNHLMFIDYTFSLLGITNMHGKLKKYSSNDIRYNSKLYGPTCDTFDCLLSSVKLPELHTNDWLIWPNMGAYTNAKRSSFNGILPPDLHYFMSDEDKKLMNKLEAAKKNNRNELKI